MGRGSNKGRKKGKGRRRSGQWKKRRNWNSGRGGSSEGGREKKWKEGKSCPPRSIILKVGAYEPYRIFIIVDSQDISIDYLIMCV